jgi:DNA invertase Pin-like site-specific DNA recombinase
MFIAYYRVSTQQQGRSGLGLEAQRAAVGAFLDRTGGTLGAEFTDVETGKGRDALDRRPQLRAALESCRVQKATLLIAKLDRLARNVHFVTGLIESRVDFVAADAPEANKTMIQMYAVMGEWERDQISKRTKDALAAAKARGVRLGLAGPQNLKANNAKRTKEALEFAENLRAQINTYRENALTQREMAARLNDSKTPAPRGGRWGLVQVQRLLKNLNLPVGVTTVGDHVGTW